MTQDTILLSSQTFLRAWMNVGRCSSAQQKLLKEKIQLGERSVRLLQYCGKSPSSSIRLNQMSGKLSKGLWPAYRKREVDEKSMHSLEQREADDRVVPVLAHIFEHGGQNEEADSENLISGLSSGAQSNLKSCHDVQQPLSGSEGKELDMILLCLARLESLKSQVGIHSAFPSWMSMMLWDLHLKDHLSQGFREHEICCT